MHNLRSSLWQMQLFIVASILSLLFCESGSGQTYNTMVDNGPSSNRVDMIFIGDGYLASQLDTVYVNHVSNTLGHFFDQPLGQPFGRYKKFFNAHRVNIASNEEGADQPPLGIFKDTALDSSYWWGGGPERCLYFTTSKAQQAIDVAMAGTGISTRMLFGVVNDTKYGGCGGIYGVYAGGNSAANEIAIHEVGHSFARLADEYFTPGTTYTDVEPDVWNLTKNPGSGKWDRWVGYNDPNSDIGPIGYFQGGGYYEVGLYRPSFNSKMRALNRPFDAISREKFINDIYDEVRPIDNWLANDNPIADPSALWVDVVDSDVIKVEWFLDNVSLGVLGESLDLNSLGLAPGQHQISALAFDEILNHSFSGNSLDWWRLNPDKLQQTVSWNVVVSVPEPHVGLFLAIVSFAVASRRRRRRASLDASQL